MSWVFFAIAAPAIYGVSNFIDKFLIEKRVRDPLLIAAFGGVPAIILGGIVLAARNFETFGFSQTALVIAAGILGQLALVPYFKALSLDETSRVVPLFQLVPVFVLILAFGFLGELLAFTQIAGFILILVGGFILSARKLRRGIFRPRPSLWYIIAASLLIAAAAVIFRFVVIAQNFWGTLAYEFIGAGIGSALLIFLPRFRKSLRDETKKFGRGVWGIITTNELVFIGGRLCTFYAISLAPVSLVTVLNGFQPFFVLLYGIALSLWFPDIIKEDTAGSVVFPKIIAIILIFLGAWVMNGVHL